jgi:hypothetical protein
MAENDTSTGTKDDGRVTLLALDFDGRLIGNLWWPLFWGGGEMDAVCAALPFICSCVDGRCFLGGGHTFCAVWIVDVLRFAGAHKCLWEASLSTQLHNTRGTYRQTGISFARWIGHSSVCHPKRP